MTNNRRRNPFPISFVAYGSWQVRQAIAEAVKAQAKSFEGEHPYPSGVWKRLVWKFERRRACRRYVRDQLKKYDSIDVLH